MKKRNIFLVGLLLLIVIVGGFYYTKYSGLAPQNSKADLITVSSPRPNTVVASPLTVTGVARGTWYFEASFPVKLVDSSGAVVAQAPARAQSDWMTTDFVPFQVTLTFASATPGVGQLILSKDNPSGDPAKDNSLVIPVMFGNSLSVGDTKGICKPSGCSGEICADSSGGGVVSNCLYLPEYACYKTAVCERQASGACGWTETSALKQCIQNAKSSALPNQIQ